MIRRIDRHRLYLGLASLSLFAMVALLVEQHLTGNFDRAGMVALGLGGGRGPEWLITIARVLTFIGKGAVRPFVLGVALGAALMIHRWRSGLLMLLAFGINEAITQVFKFGMARPRPRIVPWLDDPSSFSFPSGHASSSMVMALAIAFIVPPGRGRTLALTLAVLLALAIGMSRPMLGVHWPSDVIGGWLLGGGVAATLFAFFNEDGAPSMPAARAGGAGARRGKRR